MTRGVLVPLGTWLIAIGMVALAIFAVESLPDESQSGTPVVDDPQRSTISGPEVGLTTYCLPGSRLRVFERPFPMGGTQPMFSVVEVSHEPPGSPYTC